MDLKEKLSMLVHIFKKFSQSLFGILIIFSCFFCHESIAKPSKLSSKILVVYYSHSENTKFVADMIKSQLRADIASIETTNKYPSSISRTKAQKFNTTSIPKIKKFSKDLKKYDIIVIGSPVWNSKPAPAIQAFLKDQDLSGKTVCFFTTYEKTPGSAISDMKSACPKSSFGPTKDIRFSTSRKKLMKSSAKNVRYWINQIRELSVNKNFVVPKS